jgi:acyl carrier protein
MLDDIKALLASTLQLGSRAAHLERGTALLGNLPELDSMAVVSVITALEERYGFTVNDDEISAETFATLGSLVDFVERKLAI